MRKSYSYSKHRGGSWAVRMLYAERRHSRSDTLGGEIQPGFMRGMPAEAGKY
jgi:hypothetical protein